MSAQPSSRYVETIEYEAHCAKQLAKNPAFNAGGYLFEKGVGWIQTIKALRSLTGCDIYTAQRMALRDDRWRRWCARQFVADRACAKQLRSHVKHHKDDALVTISEKGIIFNQTVIGLA